MVSTLEALQQVLDQRKQAFNNSSDEKSYVIELHKKGLNKILEKVGEEATETILAAKDVQSKQSEPHELIAETADLWFHSLVMLSHLDINHQAVLDELARRFGLSGLDEKAARSSKN